MYVVTRNDLTLQYQLPQTIHAVVQFANEYPKEQRAWFNGSNTVVVVAAKDLNELNKFVTRLEKLGVKFSKFFEPDIDNELTAITLVPSPANKKLCSSFKLAGK